MTDKQENNFTMFTVLHGYLTQNIAVVSTVAAFQRAYQKLGELINSIRDVDSGRKTITSGKSEVKAAAKNALASAIFQVSSALYTYGDEENLPEIRQRADNTENYYRTLRDTALLNEAGELIRLTEGKEAELAEHGLTAEEIADVPVKAEALRSAIVSIGTSSGASINATKSVYELDSEARALIANQLDRHAARFRESNPEFYNGYKLASRVIEVGVRHEQRNGTPESQP